MGNFNEYSFCRIREFDEHRVATADIDNDGDNDIIIAIRGGHSILLMNQTN